MRHYALCAAFALVFATGAALADHAIEPDQATEDHAVQADRAVETDRSVELDRAVENRRAIAAEEIAEMDAPQEATVVTGITREVCTVRDWGPGEVRRECLTEVLPPREPNPALEGICMIKYGLRTCY